MFAEAARYIAHPTIRNHGTAGAASGIAESYRKIPGLLVLLDGHVGRLLANRGEANSGPPSCFVAPSARVSARRNDHGASIPGSGRMLGQLLPRTGPARRRFRRGRGRCPRRAQQRARTGARIMLLGAESVPVRASAVEASLVGKPITEATAAEAGGAVGRRAAATAISAPAPHTASTCYRIYTSRAAHCLRPCRSGGMMEITLTVNGIAKTLKVEPRRLLADVLRHEFGCYGVHSAAIRAGACGCCARVPPCGRRAATVLYRLCRAVRRHEHP